jgi:hypothetical protein
MKEEEKRRKGKKRVKASTKRDPPNADYAVDATDTRAGNRGKGTASTVGNGGPLFGKKIL